MANPLGKTLLSLVAACVVHGAAQAQDAQESFLNAVRKIRTAQQEDGLVQLRAVMDADPSQEEAFAIWKSHDVAVFEMLLSMGGEYEAIARELMTRATPERKSMSRDAAAIEALVATALSNDSTARRAAVQTLRENHSEFAVPALLQIIGNPDESKRTDRALAALVEIGRPAVQPLVAALHSDNPVLRRNCALALGYIGDRRAAGKLADLAANDPRDAVRYAARTGLEQFGMADVDAAEILVADAEAYLQLSGSDASDGSEVVWHWADNGLVAVDVPPALYNFEMAKIAAGEALQVDPSRDRAAALLAQGYLAQAQAIESNSELSDLDGEIPSLRMVAQGLGRALERSDVAEASVSRVAEVVEAGMNGLAEEREMPENLTRDLLDDEDSRIRYSAALSLSQSIESGDSAAGKVVDVLAQAVTEEAVRAVLIIDGNPLAQRIADEASNVRGISASRSDTGRRGVIQFYDAPLYDVVFVSDSLNDYLAKDVIALIKGRNPKTKVVGIVTSDEGEEKLGDQIDSTIRPETGLTAELVLEAIESVSDEMDPARARAEGVAVAAASALHGMGERGFDTASAAGALAAQLDRELSVSVPAALALGHAGGTDLVPSLLAIAANAETDVTLRTASAEALGGIYARTGAIEDAAFASLLAVASNADNDVQLRKAAAIALGKSDLTPVQRASLTATLATIAGVRAEM